MDKLKEETGNPNVSFQLLDLSSLESIRNFVQEFIQKATYPLFALICNAAIFPDESKDFARTKDNFELTYGVNYLGHFLLSNLLLSHISSYGTIIFVTCDFHNPIPLLKESFKPIHSEILAFPEKSKKQISHLMRYSLSKLCNSFCAIEMNRRLRQKSIGVRVNALNPGLMIETKLFQNGVSFPKFSQRFFSSIFSIFFWKIRIFRNFFRQSCQNDL